MPRRLPLEIDTQLVTQVGNSTNGLSLDELLRLLKGEISRRSLQRRLSKLVDAERLTYSREVGVLKGDYGPVSIGLDNCASNDAPAAFIFNTRPAKRSYDHLSVNAYRRLRYKRDGLTCSYAKVCNRATAF